MSTKYEDLTCALRRMRIMTCLLACCAAMFSVDSARAQSTIQLPIIATGKSTIPLTAAEATYHVMARNARTETEVGFRRAYPVDSMNRITSAEGTRWLTSLNATSVQGIQLDPSGSLGVAAGQETYAKSQIAERLATAGLTYADKAFTYLTAVQAFSNQYHPERLATAESYMRELDAMGDSAASWRVQAKQALVETYYALGRTQDVIRHGTSAIALAPVVPFYDRRSIVFLGGVKLYQATVEALSGQPTGRAAIDQMHKSLRAATVLPPEVAALDQSFAYEAREFETMLNEWMAVSARLGTKGSPLAASEWLNRPNAGAEPIPVNDGKIRVLEVGTYGCPPCILALYGLSRLHDKFPNVEVALLTWTGGSWGNRLVEGDVEAAHLKEYFLNVAKVTFPISIWKGKKAINEDGGLTPENPGPNAVNYPVVGKPMLWVLDGTGTIRQAFVGYSRDIEAQIAKTVQFLEREATAASL